MLGIRLFSIGFRTKSDPGRSFPDSIEPESEIESGFESDSEFEYDFEPDSWS